MWDLNYILKPVSQKIGLSPEEIRKTPWSEIEEKLGIKNPRQKFLDEEEEVMEDLGYPLNKQN